MKIKYFMLQFSIVKKNFKLIIFIAILIIFTQLPSVSSESNRATYDADKIYLKNPINPKKKNVVLQPNKITEDNSDLDNIDENFPENNFEDTDKNEIINNTLSNEIINATKAEEKPLFKKIIEKNIIRTDIPSYLLSDELTFTPDKGPISKVQFFGTYNGYVSSLWTNKDYDTNYTTNFVQVGAMGRFRNTNTDFKIILNPKGVHGRSYLQNFIADAYIVTDIQEIRWEKKAVQAHIFYHLLCVHKSQETLVQQEP